MFDIRRYLTPVAATKSDMRKSDAVAPLHNQKHIEARLRPSTFHTFVNRNLVFHGASVVVPYVKRIVPLDKITFLSKATLVNRKHKSLGPLRIHVYRLKLLST